MQESILTSMTKQMKYKTRLTKAATRDMDLIFDYISKELKSESSAYKTMDKIKEAILNLEEFPFIFSLMDEKPWKERGFRKAVVGNYLIIYGVDEYSWNVIVYKVINSRMDVNLILNDI